MSQKPRKKRNETKEYFAKASLALMLEKKLGKYELQNNIRIVFLDSGKNIICPYSSFSKEYNRWFWGIPKKYWDNWQNNYYLALILENEIQGHSFILLGPKESKKLLTKTSVQQKNKNKIICLCTLLLTQTGQPVA